MFKKNSFVWGLALLLVLALAITACGRGGNREPEPTPTPMPTPEPTPEPEPEDDEPEDEPPEDITIADPLLALRQLEAQFPISSTNPNPIIPGGTFRWARGQISSFPGLFHPWLASDGADIDIGGILAYGLLGVNDEQMFTNEFAGSPTTFEYCLEELSFTISMRPEVEIHWSDGVELSLADLAYAIWFIAHPDYTGTRFRIDNHSVLIVGANEFNASNPADAQGYRYDIEGLVLSNNDRTLKIYFTEMPPAMMFAGGIVDVPLPRHHFEDIPVADTAGHINSRDNFLGFGPFIIDTIEAGESVLLRANPNYWQGPPYLEYVYYSIVAPGMMTELMRSGEYDKTAIRPVDWAEYGGDNTNNVEFLGRIAGNQSFIYFALGAPRICDETDEIYFIPRYDNHPITDVRVRHAIALAMDHETINMTIRGGLHTSATSVLHPYNTGRWINPYSFGFAEYNPARANQILDDAGYVIGPEGFRLDLDGNPFHVNIGWRTNPGIDEIVWHHYFDNMSAIGIDFRLWDDAFIPHGILVERNILGGAFDLCPNDDMHMLQMSWSMESNPDPSVLWGHNVQFSLARFTNDTFQSILADIASVYAWNHDFLADAYMRLAEAFDYYLPGIYETWSIDIEVLNARVANWTLLRCRFGPESFSWHRVGVTALEGYVHRDDV